MYIGSNSVLFCSCRTRLHISSLMMRKKQSSVLKEQQDPTFMWRKTYIHRQYTLLFHLGLIITYTRSLMMSWKNKNSMNAKREQPSFAPCGSEIRCQISFGKVYLGCSTMYISFVLFSLDIIVVNSTLQMCWGCLYIYVAWNNKSSYIKFFNLFINNTID